VSQPEAVPGILDDAGASNIPDLLALAAEIVSIDSVSHNESELADTIEADLRRTGRLRVDRIGETVVARTELARSSRVILAGHTDTVPGNGDPRAEIDGDVLSGLGSVDMKGGLAVLIALAVSVEDPASDITFVFYPCEEVGQEHNGLRKLVESHPELLVADAAVLGEPTNGLVEAGCQGTLHALVRFAGRRAHTARPFTGVNAIHRAATLLERLSSYESRRVLIDGCEYAEQLQAVGIEGGIAGNVVPDKASVKVNFRFAPDRDANGAVAALEELIGPAIDRASGDEIEVLEVTEGAPPSLGSPMLARLVAATGRNARAKVGWTDVATFSSLGIPATNFGPGDPLLAHTADERVSRSELDHVFVVLEKLVTGAESA
jgi:succinyl-diaminopimelate desuccinylase